MKVVVAWEGREAPHEFEFNGTTSDGFGVAIGARSIEGGPKSAPTPKELVALGMGSCSGIDVVSILKKMRQPLTKLSVSCDVVLRKTPPTVFESVELIYYAEGDGLSPDRVARAVNLSLEKDCGVSIMIANSGCKVTGSLFVNGMEVALK
ncbi:MAG: OsmC family protein [Silvanigrellales bacterium]|jgi:putative redox protein|nr:OsmC family protein [Silvanigrellales bacterium]